MTVLVAKPSKNSQSSSPCRFNVRWKSFSVVSKENESNCFYPVTSVKGQSSGNSLLRPLLASVTFVPALNISAAVSVDIKRAS